MSTQTLVIVNPASAGGRTRDEWPAIEAALRAANVEFDARMTAGPGDATRIARAALHSGVLRVVACGGDGTLNEIVSAYLDDAGAPIAPAAAVGLLPSGTGGDFRRTAGIPADPAGAAAVLAGGHTRQIDAGIIEYDGGASRVFLNIADCGVGGEVVRRVNAAKRKPRGGMAYLMAVMRTVLTYPPIPTRVEVDGVPLEGAMASVVVANGCFFGGGMHIAPHAELADRELDVIIGCVGRIRSITGSRHVYKGEHLGRPGTFALRGREIRITPLGATEMPFDVDGEHLGAAPATVRVLPGAVRLCAPSQPGLR